MAPDWKDCPCSGKNMSNLAAPWILLTLFHYPDTHGYEIKKKVEGYLDGLDIGLNITGLYRHLNILEKRGMLISQWDTREKGPARRRYSLTDSGKECLWRWIQTLNTQSTLIGRFFEQARSVFPTVPYPELQLPVIRRRR
jgi:DNA-binding PadR family transcriptional regulator